MNSAMSFEPARVRRPLVVAVYVAVFFGVLPATLLALGSRLDTLFHFRELALHARVLGIAMLLAGVAGTAWSMLTLSLVGRGLPISHLPPERLVARGPYAYARHPIYVAYTLGFAGVGLAMGSFGRGVLASAILAFGSIVYATQFEEQRLRRRFGPAYVAYADEVPAFGVRLPVLRWHWLERLANHVVLFRVGRTIWVTYGAFAALGAALGLTVLRSSLAGLGSARFLVALAVSIMASARVVALLYDVRTLLTAPREALRRVGFVSWGGYLGGALATFGLGASLDVFDRLLAAGLVCSSIGRLGCLAYGCCYGRRSSCGVHFRNPESKVVRLGEAGTRVPTQLFSSAWAALVAPLVIVTTHHASPGVATVLGVFVYAVGRFAIECLRDEPRFVLALTRGQIAAAALWLAALCALLIVPFAGAATPMTFTAPSLPEVAAIAVASLFVFVVTAVHVDRVGRW